MNIQADYIILNHKTDYQIRQACPSDVLYRGRTLITVCSCFDGIYFGGLKRHMIDPAHRFRSGRSLRRSVPLLLARQKRKETILSIFPRIYRRGTNRVRKILSIFALILNRLFSDDRKRRIANLRNENGKMCPVFFRRDGWWKRRVSGLGRETGVGKWPKRESKKTKPIVY